MTPLVYVLMNKKSEQAYSHVFKYVHENLFNLSCKSFMSDFETGMRNALRSLIPNVPANGCWFHYVQAIRRKAAELGLHSKQVKKIKEFVPLFRRFKCLPLLPAENIEAGFKLLEGQAKGINIPQLDAFVNYFNKQWIVRVRKK